MPFDFKRIEEISGLVVIEPAVFRDDRGFFMETYAGREFSASGIKVNFVQDNHSKSKRAVLRGLHYQSEPMPQAKLVRCVSGRIFDAAVDIRAGSATFGRWFGVELSERNNKMLFIPPGFAHGFVVLSEEAEVLYKTDNFYSREHERGIIWNDPDVNIQWPVKNPILSEKDARLPRLKDAEAVPFKRSAL